MSYLPADDDSFQIKEKTSTVKSVFANQQNLEARIFEIPQAKSSNQYMSIGLAEIGFNGYGAIR